MLFEYKHKYDEYRKCAPIELGKSYPFKNEGNKSCQIYFSISFFSVFMKFKSKCITRLFNYLILSIHKQLLKNVKYLSICIDSGVEKSEHKIIFSGYSKYYFVYSDVLNDWVDIISNRFSTDLSKISIKINALDSSGKVIHPKFFYGSLFISELLFLKEDKGKNIIYITAESLNDFDYLLKEKMISDETYQLYKKIFDGFTIINKGVSQGDWTFPVTFSYNTGLLPSQHKMFNSERIRKGIDILSNHIQTISELLKREGYLTFSATLGRVNVEYGFARGIDFYYKPVTELGNFEYTADDKWIIKKLEHFKKNCFIHAHIDRLHAPFCTTNGPWSRVKKLSTPKLADDDTLLNPEDYYETNLRFLLFEMNNLISYLKLNNQFEDTILIVTGDHGTAIGDWFSICQKNSLVDSRVRIPYLVNQKTKLKSKNANVRHIFDICSMLEISLPAYFKKLPQNNEEFISYSFSEAILKTRNDLYLLAIRDDNYSYFFYADINWSNFSIKRFEEEYMISSQDGKIIQDRTLLEKFVNIREKFFKINQDFYSEMKEIECK